MNECLFSEPVVLDFVGSLLLVLELLFSVVLDFSSICCGFDLVRVRYPACSVNFPLDSFDFDIDLSYLFSSFIYLFTW